MNIKFLAGYFRFLWQETFEPDPLRKRKSHPMIKEIAIFGLWHSYLKDKVPKTHHFSSHVKVKSRKNRDVFAGVQYPLNSE